MAFVVTSFRFLLGFVFLLASVPKLLAPHEFRFALRNYGLLPQRLVGPAAVLIPLVELLCATFLLLGVGVPIAAAFVGCLLALFSAAVAINLIRGKQFDCGCAGLVAPRRISWRMILRNGLLAAVAVWLAVRPPRGASILVAPWPSRTAGTLSPESVGAVATGVGLGVLLVSLVITTVRLEIAARRFALSGGGS